MLQIRESHAVFLLSITVFFLQEIYIYFFTNHKGRRILERKRPGEMSSRVSSDPVYAFEGLN